MYTRYLFILISSLLLACSTKKGTVLPKEKMQAVLWDLAQAGEFLNSYVYFKNPTQNRAAINNTLLHKIFEIHKINKDDFDKSLQYYKAHPKDFAAILDTITTRQNRIDHPEAASPDSDSLNRPQSEPAQGPVMRGSRPTAPQALPLPEKSIQ
ncbi:hypothetical protein GCM10027051_06880 [Niabella terrae]